MFALVILWGARLTFNFARKGGYARGGEDYRWAVLRGRMAPGANAARCAQTGLEHWLRARFSSNQVRDNYEPSRYLSVLSKRQFRRTPLTPIFL